MLLMVDVHECLGLDEIFDKFSLLPYGDEAYGEHPEHPVEAARFGNETGHINGIYP